MQFSIFSLSFAAALVAAQSDGIPKCATQCVSKFTTGNEFAGCKQLDTACICKNNSFLEDIACCLSTACDQAGQDAAVKYAKQICSSQGVSTPDKVVCKESVASASASASGSSASQSGTATAASASGSGTQTSSSTAQATTTNAAVSLSLSGAGSLVGAAVAMLAVL